ncbi:MAG: DDE-type integrase/transposase/recombinase [archaeon]
MSWGQIKFVNKKLTKYKKLSCPNCNFGKVIKRGFRKTQNRGKIQRYSCWECNYRFVKDDGFFRMRNHPKKITCAIDLFYRGVSTRKIKEHFQAFYPHNSSNVSIYNWIIKYAEMISKFTNKLKLQVGNEVQIDEIEYKRRLYHQKGKKGVEEDYFIDSIDTKTRFLTASNFSNQREIKDLKEVTNKIKVKTGKQVKVCTTDGLKGYSKAIKKAWGYNLKENKYNVYHNQVITSKTNTFNYPIERLHNTVRERTKTMRDFHGCIESAQAIMKGFEIFYNFIRKHQAINCCPYELATDLKLKSNNKWLELIGLSKSINN